MKNKILESQIDNFRMSVDVMIIELEKLYKMNRLIAIKEFEICMDGFHKRGVELTDDWFNSKITKEGQTSSQFTVIYDEKIDDENSSVTT